MTAIRLLLPRGDIRRWHRILADRLSADGHCVLFALCAARNQPAGAMALLDAVERLLYVRGDAHQSDLLAPGEWLPLEKEGEAELVFDLSGAAAPAARAIVPLFNGWAGDIARDAGLMADGPPILELARADGDNWQILARALPAVGPQTGLVFGRDALADRTIALVRQAARGVSLAHANAVAPGTKPRLKPMRFLAAALLERVRRRLMRLVAHENHWAIGLRKLAAGQTAYQSFDGPRDASWQWLTDDRQRYFADPFLFEDQGRTFVFCEEYPYSTGKGVISMFALDADGRAGQPRIVLERPHHLSYPNVFRRDGQIWMMPESSGARTLELYRADPFPYRWTLDRSALKDTEISDATIFQWKDDWILSGATNEPGTSSWDCLSLYSGPGPLGPWAALGDGPQLIDASAARPAGNVFLHGDALLRPAQDCTDGYGSGLAFCRIDEVGPGSFRQTIVRRLRPPARVHTFNFTPRYVAIDRAGTRARNPSLAGLARR